MYANEPLKKSGISPKTLPAWYEVINPTLTVTCKIDEKELASQRADLSFSEDEDSDDDDTSDSIDEEQEVPGSVSLVAKSRQHPALFSLQNVAECSKTNEEEIQQDSAPKKKGKFTVKAHRRKPAVRSQTQALSQVAAGLNKMAEGLASRHKRQMEMDTSRDKQFLEFKQKENDANRKHELEIAKIFANAIAQSSTRPAQSQWPQLPQNSRQGQEYYGLNNSFDNVHFNNFNPPQ